MIALLALTATARANPIDAFGFGARASSLGGAQTAAGEDGGVNYYNPALLTHFDDIRIDLGYQYARPALLVNGLDLGVDSSRGTHISLSAPGDVAGARIAIGAAVFLPDQHLTRTRTLSTQQPRFALYDNRPQRLFLSVNLAAQITDRLSIGAGLSYMSSTQGQVDLDGRVGFPDPDDSDLALQMDVDLKPIRYGQIGLAYRANPWLLLGLSYRDSFSLVLDQVFEITGDVGSSTAEPVVQDGFFILHTVSQDLFQPAQLTAGLDAQLTGDLALAFDLQWQRWSAYENPSAQITIDLDIGDFNELIDIPPPLPLPDLNFHDIVVPRLGVEWIASRGRRRDIAVRGGYTYEPSPVPEQFAETNFIDADKHTLAAGAGLTLRRLTAIIPKPVSIDATVAVTLLDPRAQAKLSPIDPVGEYRASGRVWQAAITSRWRF